VKGEVNGSGESSENIDVGGTFVADVEEKMSECAAVSTEIDASFVSVFG